jgi:hypothetical protein
MLCVLAVFLWESTHPVLAASQSNAQLVTTKLPAASEDCQISDAARDAIDAATEAWMKAGNVPQALDLILQAEAATKPPDCDNTKAVELAGRAIELVRFNFQEDPAQHTLSNDRTSIFIEGGARVGGDELSSDEAICIDLFDRGCPGSRIGGGAHLAVGFRYFVGENKSESLSLALGYLWDNSFDEKVSSTTLETIYSHHDGLHRVGIGLSYHLDPRYEEEISDSKKIQLDFDDAFGIVFKYGYLIRQTDWHVGVRYTIMDYKIGSVEVDASSFGIYGSKSFQ